MSFLEKIDEYYSQLKVRYKLIIFNEDNLEEYASIVSTPLRFLITISSILIVLIILVIFLIAFTPLREYIPGYSDTAVREQAYRNANVVDSLYNTIQQKDMYITNVMDILKGKTPKDRTQSKDEEIIVEPASLKNEKIDEDAKLRKYVEEQDEYNVYESQTDINIKSTNPRFSFFTPIKGVITNKYNPAEKHYGVDVVASKNEAVKSIMKGTVINADWTSESGNVIAVQHPSDIVSIYKHNSVLLKKVGDVVRAGESIAIIGNSGEITSGPHLHFEIWNSGSPINPEEYIVF